MNPWRWFMEPFAEGWRRIEEADRFADLGTDDDLMAVADAVQAPADQVAPELLTWEARFIVIRKIASPEKIAETFDAIMAHSYEGPYR